jgi:hypothetical protein
LGRGNWVFFAQPLADEADAPEASTPRLGSIIEK